MPEVKELERKNLHNQMWTFTNKGENSQIDKIFKGDSPFDDGGKLEVIEGFPEGFEIPQLNDAPQEFASGLDSELKRLTQELQTLSNKNINNFNQNSNDVRSCSTESYIITDTTETPNNYSSANDNYARQTNNGDYNINWTDVIKKRSKRIG